MTISNNYTQFVTLTSIKEVDVQGLIDQFNMLAQNPDALTNDAPQVADFNGKITALQALAASLGTF